MKKRIRLRLAVLFVLCALSFAAPAQAEETAQSPDQTQTESPRETPAPTKAPTAEPAKAPTAEPTKAPTAVPTKAPTAEPTKAPTAEPTKAPTAEPTKAPTAEPTKAPTAEPTKAPTAAPTEIPAAEATQTPEVEATQTPEVEATEAPEVEATEAPEVEATETPEVEATETPEVEAMQTPAVEATETPEAEATEAPAAEATEAPEVEATQTPAAETTETPEVEATQMPEVEATEMPEAETTQTPEVEATQTPEAEATETPEATQTPVPALQVSVSTSTAYAFAGEDAIRFSVKIRGGAAPYTIALELYNVYADVPVSARETVQEETGTYVFKCTPKAFGVHRVRATVVDAQGQTAGGSVEVPVPVRERELPGVWEKSVAAAERTGDWRHDLVAVARTQIGYRESARNFIVEDGAKIGYTRYGGWYGADYGKWCAMFVAFCAEYAGIPQSAMPRDSNVRGLYQKVRSAGALEDADYAPRAGDLVFFDWRTGTDYDHVGIVERFEDGIVHTIEGNSANRVRRREYAADDRDIIGYCNTESLMRRAGAAP